MSEIIKAKYIDLMVDWSFKRVFGTEVNKDILIEFLKVVFPQFAITDITYIPTEHRYQLLETKTLKRMYASTFPHCSMKSSEYLWPKTKRLVKDERRSKSKLRVCA